MEESELEAAKRHVTQGRRTAKQECVRAIRRSAIRLAIGSSAASSARRMMDGHDELGALFWTQHAHFLAAGNPHTQRMLQVAINCLSVAIRADEMSRGLGRKPR
jgi:hypothetical protein